jgi:hypothetical protein
VKVRSRTCAPLCFNYCASASQNPSTILRIPGFDPIPATRSTLFRVGKIDATRSAAAMGEVARLEPPGSECGGRSIRAAISPSMMLRCWIRLAKGIRVDSTQSPGPQVAPRAAGVRLSYLEISAFCDTPTRPNRKCSHRPARSIYAVRYGCRRPRPAYLLSRHPLEGHFRPPYTTPPRRIRCSSCLSGT